MTTTGPSPLPQSPTHQLEAYRIAIFKAHCSVVLGTHLEPWARALASQRQPSGPQDPHLRAVIVDDRPTPLLRMTVLNTLLMGRQRWGVTLYTAPASLERSRALFADLAAWVSVVGLRAGEADHFDWLAYNRLLKTAAFWAQLPAPKLLLFQTDTLLIEPPDPAVFAYGYVGSPWAKGRHVSQAFPRYGADLEPLPPVWLTRRFCNTVPEGMSNGNGGLSVRDRQLMVRICQAEAAASPPEEPEDIFFARHLARHDPTPPPPTVVERFSCETAYHASAGAHAAWRYLTAAEVAEMYERHLKQVLALTCAPIS
ncbi:hypothetical protein H8F24_06490 [Synechococcus sp. CBW1002]|uniref:DUF5672 family protein n=1 Tax=Synechococcus sp. CBW1002 TaxID=1353134 RepID=UPI0018CD4B78|nr:DUF5672 family protein [Synechococcus sp. CBW1002]QPN60970.1 hypothetical protein H8F24_06490 [Synechococcus sp. CBW1002]